MTIIRYDKSKEWSVGCIGTKIFCNFFSFFLSYRDVSCRAFRYGGRTNEETLADFAAHGSLFGYRSLWSSSYVPFHGERG